MPHSTTPTVGQRVELGRYRISSGARVLYGQRINRHVRITDVPERGGRRYLVERKLDQDANDAIHALIVDYINESQRRDEPAILVNLNPERSR